MRRLVAAIVVGSMASTLAHAAQSLRISGSPAASIAAGKTYSFQPRASGSGTLVFAISNKPAWAGFSTSTGLLSGTADAGNVGTTSNIVVSVSDGKRRVSLPAFSITVTGAVSATPVNHPPSIGGSPATAVATGSAYVFAPAAADSDGDSLTFSIANLPAWAGFDRASGRLTGTPAAQDVGVYSNIVISVSDGKASTSLAAFSVTVNQIATGVVTLSWMPPTQNADGTAVTLAGYRLYSGSSATALARQVDLPSPGITSYVLSNVASGLRYYAITAYDFAGAESPLSPVISNTIN